MQKEIVNVSGLTIFFISFTDLSFISLQDFEAAVTKQINAENERDALAEELQFTQDTLNAVSAVIQHSL